MLTQALNNHVAVEIQSQTNNRKTEVSLTLDRVSQSPELLNLLTASEHLQLSNSQKSEVKITRR